MIEATGNLWTYPADHVVITTNGFVKKNGACVMGRGCALEAREMFKGIDRILGNLIKEYGNHVHSLLWTEYGAKLVWSFPVKHNWFEKADLALIERSAQELVAYIDDMYEADKQRIVVPRPGCGNGGLRWQDVKPVLEKYFDDRFVVIDYGKTDKAREAD